MAGEVVTSPGTLPTVAHEHIVVYSTKASEYLAEKICAQLHAAKGDIIRKAFGDGERYYRINIEDKGELMGKNIVFVASTHTDEELLEVIRVGSALANGCGVRRIVFCIPFLGYSTMERAVKPGEVVTAKVNIRLLSTIPSSALGNSFLFLDLHVSGLLHYFEGSSLRSELYAEKVLIEGIERFIREDGLKEGDFMFASADLGRPLWVQSFANNFHTGLAFIQKARNFESTYVLNVIGSVKDKHVIIYDDMTRSGATLVHAAEAYIANGAKSVYCALSHLAFNNEDVIDLLSNSVIKRIVSTNSHPMSQHPKVLSNPKFIIQDVSRNFSSAVKSIIF